MKVIINGIVNFFNQAENLAAENKGIFISQNDDFFAAKIKECNHNEFTNEMIFKLFNIHCPKMLSEIITHKKMTAIDILTAGEEFFIKFEIPRYTNENSLKTLSVEVQKQIKTKEDKEALAEWFLHKMREYRYDYKVINNFLNDIKTDGLTVPESYYDKYAGKELETMLRLFVQKITNQDKEQSEISVKMLVRLLESQKEKKWKYVETQRHGYGQYHLSMLEMLCFRNLDTRRTDRSSEICNEMFDQGFSYEQENEKINKSMSFAHILAETKEIGLLEKVLIKHPDALSCKNKLGQTPVYFINNIEMFDFFKKKKVDFNIRDNNGMHALLYLYSKATLIKKYKLRYRIENKLRKISYNSDEVVNGKPIVSWFLDHKKNKNESFNKIKDFTNEIKWKLALEHGSSEILRSLPPDFIKDKIDCSNDFYFLFSKTANRVKMQGRLELLACCIDLGLDINKEALVKNKKGEEQTATVFSRLLAHSRGHYLERFDFRKNEDTYGDNNLLAKEAWKKILSNVHLEKYISKEDRYGYEMENRINHLVCSSFGYKCIDLSDKEFDLKMKYLKFIIENSSLIEKENKINVLSFVINSLKIQPEEINPKLIDNFKKWFNDKSNFSVMNLRQGENLFVNSWLEKMEISAVTITNEKKSLLRTL